MRGLLAPERVAARTPHPAVKETPEFVAFVARSLRALGRRVGVGDVDGLAHFRELRQVLDAAEREAARALHDYGYSWTDIALRLGTTRQAARQRFAG